VDGNEKTARKMGTVTILLQALSYGTLNDNSIVTRYHTSINATTDTIGTDNSTATNTWK
jgi:hypothetical protein